VLQGDTYSQVLVRSSSKTTAEHVVLEAERHTEAWIEAERCL
jgi:hypothetical protein